MPDPLEYHRTVRGELLRYYPSVWKTFSSDVYKAQHAEQLRLSLLKRTYRLDPESHPLLHSAAREAAETLGVTVPIELYQGPDQGTLNASLYFVPEAAQLVMFGALDTRLARDELLALMGHELAHHVLYTMDFGDFLTTARVLDAMAEAADSPALSATARLYQLSTEMYADRGSVAVAGSDAAIRCLLKTETGLANPDARAFLRQVDEVLAQDTGGSNTQSHPETYLRARALSLFEANPPDLDAQVHRLIEGPVQLDALDLIRRRDLTTLTRQLVDLFFEPSWIQRPGLLQAAQMLFDDYEPALDSIDVTQLVAGLGPYHDSVWDYLTYILTDFVACDPTLEKLPLARAQVVAESLGARDRLEGHVNKELKVTKRDIAHTWSHREALFQAAQVADD